MEVPNKYSTINRRKWNKNRKEYIGNNPRPHFIKEKIMIIYKSILIDAFNNELDRTPDSIIKTKLDISNLFQNAICDAEDKANKLPRSEKLKILAQEILNHTN